MHQQVTRPAGCLYMHNTEAASGDIICPLSSRLARVQRVSPDGVLGATTALQKLRCVLILEDVLVQAHVHHQLCFPAAQEPLAVPHRFGACRELIPSRTAKESLSDRAAWYSK